MWPEDALEAVATRFLEDIEMSEIIVVVVVVVCRIGRRMRWNPWPHVSLRTSK